MDKAYQLLKSVFNEAVRKKIICENLMLNIRKPKSKQELVKVRALTIDEQKKLINILKSEDIRYSEQMLLSMFTGMRMDEINALEVRDINFNDRTIRVSKTVSRGLNGETYISNSTKTKAGMRTIYFNDEMADFF